MKDLGVYYLVLGMVGTNTFLPYNKETKECLIIDPADEGDRIIAVIEEKKLLPKAVLLTHGHFDHIMAVNDLVAKYHLPVYISKKDEEMLSDPRKNGGSGLMGITATTKADHFLQDGEQLHFLNQDITFIETPGHTRGSGCYYFPAEKMLFSGDTMFRGDCGRTDLYGGDNPAIVRSIYKKLLTLPEDVEVFPGHMDMTTIGYERKHNVVALYVARNRLDL